MAIFRSCFRSQTLHMDTQVHFVVPCDDARERDPAACRVVYLLHGNKQNADAWFRYSQAERFAAETGCILIAPEVQRSYYSDMAQGMRYFSYVADELPQWVKKIFRFPTQRARTFAAGLSMGGYGAMKLALSRPERFAGALCFSSAFYRLEEADKMLESAAYSPAELQGLLGPALERGAQDNLDLLLDRYPASLARPLLYIACGTEDFLYANNQHMRRALDARGFACRYEEWPGKHDWRFWDAALEKGLRFLAENAPL